MGEGLGCAAANMSKRRADHPQLSKSVVVVVLHKDGGLRQAAYFSRAFDCLANFDHRFGFGPPHETSSNTTPKPRVATSSNMHENLDQPDS